MRQTMKKCVQSLLTTAFSLFIVIFIKDSWIRKTKNNLNCFTSNADDLTSVFIISLFSFMIIFKFVGH